MLRQTDDLKFVEMLNVVCKETTGKSIVFNLTFLFRFCSGFSEEDSPQALMFITTVKLYVDYVTLSWLFRTTASTCSDF